MDTGTESGSFLNHQQQHRGFALPAPSVRRKPVNSYTQSHFQIPPQTDSTRRRYHLLNNTRRQGYQGLNPYTSNALPSISEVRSSYDHGSQSLPPTDTLQNDASTRLNHQPLISEDASTTLNNHSSNTSEGYSEGKRIAIHDSQRDWKPWLLHHVGLFICCLVGHVLIYGIGRYFTERNGVIVQSVSANYWFFRFAPSFLAVFIKEWCTRLTVDYRSIDAYFPENLGDQQRPRSVVRKFFESPKLYSTGNTRVILGYTVFDIVGFIASLLVIIQSTILIEVFTTVATGTTFSVVDSQAFSNTFADTMIPALTVPSYFMNQSLTPPPWFTEMSSDFGLLTTQIGALPFRQSSQSANAESLTCVTSGFASSLKCVPILSPVVQMRSAGASQWDVLVNMKDLNGCQYQSTINAVQLTGSQNFSSGAVGDDTFAIWRYLEDSGNAGKSAGSCSPTTQFILAGRVSERSLPTTKTYTNVTALDGGWSALSCNSEYIGFNDNLRYTVNMNGSVSTVDAQAKQDAVNNTQSQSFDRTMRHNFLDTGIIATLGGWYTSKTFWNTMAQYSWSGTASNEDDGHLCASGSALMSLYKNVNTCNMYVNIETLWPTLFSLSVSAAASYIPESSWKEAQGEVVKQEYGLAVSAVALYISAFLHALMILFILTARMIHIPRFFPQSFHRQLGHRTTGLKRSPNSIVAKAELFQEQRIRDLSTGIDALEQKEANTELRERFSPLKFQMSAKEIHSATDSQPTFQESTFVDLNRNIPPPPEYESIRPLPTDEYELANLRFAYVPSILHWVTLVNAFLILGIVFASGIYMTQSEDGYYFWHESLSDTNLWRLWGQQLLFSMLPIIVLLTICWWWTKVDMFFRASQPYVGLYHSLPGKHSVCLKYINDLDIVVAMKSFKYRHFRLTLVTIITMLLKFALVLAGGLFCFQSGVSKGFTEIEPLLAWRNGTFAPSEKSFDDVARRSVLMYSIVGYPRSSHRGWQTDMFVFPPANISQSGTFQMSLSGLSADLDCQAVTTSFAPQGISVIAKLSDDDCGEVQWQDFCLFMNPDLDGESYTALPYMSKSSSSTSATSTSTSTSSTTTNSTSRITTNSSSRLNTTSTSRPTTASASQSNSASTSQITTRSTITSTNSLPTTFNAFSTYRTISTNSAKTAIPPPAPTMPGTTWECYQWYTPQPGDYCWEIAQADNIDWEVLRILNPNIDADCHNLQPYKSYCVDGLNPKRFRHRPRDVASSPGSCTGWKYIEAANCGASTNGSGKWWLIDAHGSTISSTNSSWQGLSSVQSSTSLLCTPRYWMNQVEVTVMNYPEQSMFNLTVGKIISSTQIKDNNWVQPNNASVSFSEYFSTGLQNYGFASMYYQASDTSFLDVMSLAAASNSTERSLAFKDANQFKQLASTAFGRAFAQITNRTILSDGSTFLLQPTKSSSSQPVKAYSVTLNAVPSEVPLYAILVILALCMIAIGFIHPDKARRMALDPTVVSNVVTSIYDSSIISKVKRIVEQGGDPASELREVPFSYGIYLGESSRVRRLGIDTSDKIIEYINDPAQNLSLFHHLRRRFTTQRGAGRRTEKIPLDQDSDLDVPYIAEYHHPQEIGGNTAQTDQPYILQRRFTVSGFEPPQHGTAEETGYTPPQRARTYDQPETPQTQPYETTQPPLSRAQTLKSRIGSVMASARRAGQTDALLEEDDVVVQPPARMETLDDRTQMNRDGEAGLFAVVKKFTKVSNVRVRDVNVNVNRSRYTAPDTGVPRPRGYMDSVRDWTNKWRA